jgi:hypothetical protein
VRESNQGVASEAGFSLIELMVSALLLLMTIGGLLTLVNTARQVAETQPEAADTQQRARFGASVLYRDVYGVGAGLDAGPLTGPLVWYLPPVLPRRIGAINPSPPNTAESNVISLVWVPETSTQTSLLLPLTTTVATVRDDPGCPPGKPACGLTTGMGVLVFDVGGHFDLFTTLGVAGASATLRHRGPSPAHAYAAQAFVGQVEARTYYLDSASRQLRRYDSDQTDVPVMDNVNAMQIAYFGTPNPPTAPKPALGATNCLYDAAGGLLPGLAVLPVAGGGQAALPLDMFKDGPWCGDGDTLFDADLLRVRRVTITLRVQTAAAALRGVGARFALPGVSQSVWRAVPDVAVVFDVAPRNLNLRD